MDTMETDRIDIDDSLTQRLAAIAKDQGITASDLANDVLRSFTEEIEETIASVDTAEDERRWQKYLETGESVSMEEFRAELHELAAKSAAKIGT